jgi:MFS family permease
MLMGIATFLVAFVPSYESIGIWGAVILTVLRALQGVGVGGEWGGSVLLAMEWSRTAAQSTAPRDHYARKAVAAFRLFEAGAKGVKKPLTITIRLSPATG